METHEYDESPLRIDGSGTSSSSSSRACTRTSTLEKIPSGLWTSEQIKNYQGFVDVDSSDGGEDEEAAGEEDVITVDGSQSLRAEAMDEDESDDDAMVI